MYERNKYCFTVDLSQNGTSLKGSLSINVNTLFLITYTVRKIFITNIIYLSCSDYDELLKFLVKIHISKPFV